MTGEFRLRDRLNGIAAWWLAHPLAMLAVILAVSLGVRLALFHIPGYRTDQGTFIAWYNYAAENGLGGFYDPPNWSDYPPFNAYIFWLFGKIAMVTGSEPSQFLLKIPQNIFDLGTAVLIFLFLRRSYSPKVALGVTALYAFNPATIFNLAVWGQMDSVYTFFLVATIITLLDRRYEVCGCLFALGVLTKPQTAILLPVVAWVMLKDGGWRRALFSAGVFWATVFLVILPFRWESPFVFLGERYAGYFVYPYTSLNAYNFWALVGFWQPDDVVVGGLTLQMWGLVAFIVFAVIVMWHFRKRYGSGSAIFAAFLLVFGFFMLMTRMHERYLFPVLAMLALVFPLRFVPWLYGGLTATYLFNLVYVLSVLNAGAAIPGNHWSIFVLVPANFILLLFSVEVFLRMRKTVGSGADDFPSLTWVK